MQYLRIVPAACLLLFAGCMNANADRGSETTRASEGEVTVEFRVENAQGEPARRFTPGATVHFVFDVKNGSAHAQQLAYTFPPHRLQVYFEAGSEPAWQAWQGQMFPQVMRNKTLPATSSETFSVEWKIGADVASGTYRAQPAFHGFVDNRPLSPDFSPISIVIE